MSADTAGPVRGGHGPTPGWRAGAGAGFGAILPCLLLLVPLAACAPAAEEPGGDAAAPPPRITAEHPVTARPALEAGLLDGGAMDGMPVLGEAGSVDGLGDGGAALSAILPATDVDRSLEFYTRLLGFDVTSSQPAEPPFGRVELARGGVRIVLLGPDAWEREMLRFGAAPTGGGVDAERAGGETESGEAAEGGGAGGIPSSAPFTVSAPVLRLGMEDLATVSAELAGAGLEVEVLDDTGDGPEAPGERSLAVVDPTGNRLLLVPAGDS